MPVDLGDVKALSVTVKDAAGALANAGTMTLSITLPDGTAAAGSPFTKSPTSTGIYDHDYTTTTPGRHAVRWLATGANSGAYPDEFIVRPADPGMLLTLEEAKAHLNEQGSLQDEEIRAYIEVASAIIEGIAGPVAVRTYTERVRNGTWLMKLRHTPVISVTSVTSIPTPATTYLTAALDVDKDYGIVYLLNGSSFMNGPWTAVYQAGRTTDISRHVHAVKLQLWSMWFDQRGQLADTTAPDMLDVAEFESRVPFGLGFLVPYKVMQLFESDLVPGTA